MSLGAPVETDAETVAAAGSAAVVTTSPVGDGSLPPLSCFTALLRGFTAGAGAALPVGVTAPGCSPTETTSGAVCLIHDLLFLPISTILYRPTTL